MTAGALIVRSLKFHWRTHLGVFLGALLATAILVGALAVGDSVRYSLKTMALARIGGTTLALNGGNRFFREDLANELSVDLGQPVAGAVRLPGTVLADGADFRVGRVQVIGATPEFWQAGGAQDPLQGKEGVVLNERLAQKLNAQVGQEVLLRVDKPSLLSRDAPLSTVEDASVAFRLPVTSIATDTDFGRFSLEANQVPPLNAFVPMALLQDKVALKGRINTLLVTGKVTLQAASQALQKRWQLGDAALELKPIAATGEVELRTDSVFLNPAIAQVALAGNLGGRGVLTYFVNELRNGSRYTPYSTVAAMDGFPSPADLADDEAVVTSWLAEDLALKPGSAFDIAYYVVGPKRQLREEKATFRVRSVVPLAGAISDPDLMPPYPGVAEAENCRDWKPGIPVDLDKIRDKDEAYWDAHKGTPKAFIPLSVGQKLWNNRFGNLTAVRYAGRSEADIAAALKAALNPTSLGFFFSPVRETALRASSQSLDFGGLFLGFSFFLIVAALLLAGLLFAFGVEQRAEEVGILLAVGFPPKRVQRLLLGEGALLAAVAGVIGAAIGVYYTQAVILGLSTVWSGAVAGSDLRFHAEPLTLAGGAIAGFLVSLLSIWLVVRKQAKVPARELLASGAEASSGLLAAPSRGKAPGLITAAVGTGLALILAGAAMAADHGAAVGYFFGSGMFLLIGGVAACRYLLARLEQSTAARTLTVGSLGVRNSVRRRGRSLVVIGLLASGAFLVVAVGANRHDPGVGAEKRSSGTGGFAFYGETTLPIFHDLNTPEGREAFDIEPDEIGAAHVVAMRVREGDEASCLNLNRALTPRLLGVHPSALADLNAFTFAAKGPEVGKENPWLALNRVEGDVVPGIADANTIEWSLQMGLGGMLHYIDERGQPFRVKLVASLAGSILQGAVVIAEDAFITRFPSQSGYQAFLIDNPAGASGRVENAELAKNLGRALEDVGLDLTPAPERLAAFSTVENTYLSIFAVLGGLGLLLGSLGLGVVVLRHVLERRAELALLRAVGFRKGALQWLVFSEHSLLLALGLLLGVVAALVAVAPALTSPGADVPWGSLIVTLGAVFVSGFVFTWLATAAALRSPLMAALRNE